LRWSHLFLFTLIAWVEQLCIGLHCFDTRVGPGQHWLGPAQVIGQHGVHWFSRLASLDMNHLEKTNIIWQDLAQNCQTKTKLLLRICAVLYFGHPGFRPWG
jgi:hypothetical protein